MSTTKKHLVAGAVIGGLLLAATMHSANTFALSDTPTTTDTSSDTTPPTTSTDTADPSTTPADPGSDPSDPAAGGSTATQSTDSTVDASSASTTAPDTSDMPDASPSSDVTDGTQQSNNQGNGPATQDNNTAAIDNNVNSGATTGSATVSNNQSAGNATSGDASATTTLINALASTSNLSGSGLQTFTYNLNGNVNGNIVINPNDILPAEAPSDTAIDPRKGTTTSQNNDTIDNNVNLAAATGDATVSGNGKGGNATSGNATTEADIINLIEALISDQQSFVGVININGTFNGNIELPANLINSLLSQSGGSGSSASNITQTNNIAVNNNISLSAASGDATVTDNGRGGNATSGNASTRLNIYNLINSQIVGGNVLLVFVNVMGSWYGLLMNAPAGTTSAALGGGIKQDTSVPASQVIATNNETINNNVTLSSTTGNALVSDNGRGGNATSGNATAIADIVNILGSQINLSGWLGVLIINVFGTWNGSLTVQPQAVTPTQGSNGSGSGKHHNPGKSGASASGSSRGWSGGFGYAISYPPTGGGVANTAVHILGTSTQADPPTVKPVVFDHSKDATSNVITDFIIAGIAAAAAAALGGTRFFALRRKKL